MSDSAMSEPIEDYLDELLTRLRLPTRDTRRVLAEAETHLYESAASLAAGGMDPAEAQREAVRRFGTPEQVATAADGALPARAVRLAVLLGWSGTVLTGLALAAVGLSGGFVAVANALWGPRFVGALPVVHAAADCRYWLSIHPGASSCATAAADETSWDAAVLRVLAGVLGVVLLAAALWWRGRLSHDLLPARTRDGLVSAVAAIAFAVATAALGAQSGQVALEHGSGGVGFYLTGGVASALFALACAVVALRNLRHANLLQ